MFCAECGKEVKAGAMFCGHCGTPVKSAATPVPADMKEEPKPAAPVNPVSPVNSVPPVQQAPQFTQVPPVQQAPQFNQAPPQYRPAPPPAPKAPKEPVNPLLFVVVGELALMVALAVAFVFLVRGQVSAKAVASEYFVKMANADTDGAFELVNSPNYDYAGKDEFRGYVATLGLGNVADYSVEERGGFGATTDVVVSYRENGSASQNTMKITLVKNGKTVFFMDKYQVLVSSAMGSLVIDAPAGATVTVDGNKVKEKYLDPSESSNVYDHYVIDNIFAGKHTVAMDGNGINPYYANIQIDSGYTTYVQGSNYFSKSSMMEMQSALATYMTEFYSAAAEGQPFSAVSGYFTSDVQSSAESYFNQVQQDFAGRNVEFCRVGDVLVTSYTDVAYGDIQFSYVLTTLLGDGTEKNNGGAGGNGYAYMSRNNGEWLISDFSWNL